MDFYMFPTDSASLIWKDSWPLYPEGQVYELAVTKLETDTGDGDVPHSSGSFLGYMGENYLLLIHIGLLDFQVAFWKRRNVNATEC